MLPRDVPQDRVGLSQLYLVADMCDKRLSLMSFLLIRQVPTFPSM